MKRSPMPQRKKPLARKTPLKRGPWNREAKGKPERATGALKVRELTRAEKADILERDGYTCQLCDLDCRAASTTVETSVRRLVRSAAFRCATRVQQVDVIADDCGLGTRVVEAVFRQRRLPADVDHVVPRALGGTNDPDNLRTLCCDCHGDKTAADVGAIARAPNVRRAS